MTSLGGAVPMGIFMLALFLVVGLAVKLEDVRREREDEALALQARITHALMREPSLSSLPIIPAVRVPLRQGAPVRVEIAGPVPRLELREAALRLVIREMAQTGRGFRLADRTAIIPLIFEHAA